MKVPILKYFLCSNEDSLMMRGNPKMGHELDKLQKKMAVY